MSRGVELWDGNPPALRWFTLGEQAALDKAAGTVLPKLFAAPYLPPSAIERAQTERIAELIELAMGVEPYSSLYRKFGLNGTEFKGLGDLGGFPIVSKNDLLATYPFGYPAILPADGDHTLKTYSSGSTGLTLPVHFSVDAVITDTLMGCRQLVLQSQGRVGADDLVAHYYTVPWRTNNVGGLWRSAFVSSLVASERAADFVRSLRPVALTGYASLIQAISEFNLGHSLELVIVDSEQSTRMQRDVLAAKFACPVLDEYSSEELCRIAYELPDGDYYVNEDCVYLEVLDPVTREPVAPGAWGEAVITGLLNDLMPFIRYATGDLVRRSSKVTAPWKGIQWKRLSEIGGRALDAFVRLDGSIVPSGAVLDSVYRSIAENDAALKQFELTQLSPTTGTLKLCAAHFARTSEMRDLGEAVREKLAALMGDAFHLDLVHVDGFPGRVGKKLRPVKRVF